MKATRQDVIYAAGEDADNLFPLITRYNLLKENRVAICALDDLEKQIYVGLLQIRTNDLILVYCKNREAGRILDSVRESLPNLPVKRKQRLTLEFSEGPRVAVISDANGGRGLSPNYMIFVK